jgi:hypothetical protein
MPTTVDLMGWNTVNALSFTSMNQGVLQLKNFPAKFHYADPDPSGDMTLDGTWADWSLCTGGGGMNVQMQCDIGTGTLKLGTDSTDLSKGWIKIQVNLEAVEAIDPSFKDMTGKGGTGNSLVVKKTGSNGVDPVVVLATSFDSQGSLKYIVKGIFQDALNASLDSFVQYFHSVVLNETAAQGDYQWLKPTTLAYAVTDGTTIDNSIFAALCMVEGDPATDDDGKPLANEVDGRLLEDIPAGANSVFAISAEKFVKHVLLTGAIRVIPGSAATDYDSAEDNLAFTNNKDLSWGEFVLESGEKVTPTIPAKGFRISVENDQIKLEFTGVHFVSYRTAFGDDVNIDLVQFFKLGVEKKPDGSGYVLIVKNDDNDTDIPAMSLHATVTPTKAEEDFDWAMIGIGAALAILPVGLGLIKLGKSAIQLGSKVVNLIKGVDGAAEVSVELGEMTSLLTQDSVVATQDVADAASVADAEASQGASAARTGMAMRYLTLANKFCIAGGVVTALVGISDPIGEKLAKHDVSQLPTIEGFASACLGATSWPNMSNWKLVDVRLANALILYGNLSPQS